MKNFAEIKGRVKISYFYAALLALIFLSSGCTVRQYGYEKTTGTLVKGFPTSVVMGNTVYVPASFIEKETGAQILLDKDLFEVVLQKDGKIAKTRHGSNVAILGNKRIEFNAEVRFLKNEIYFPEGLSKRLVSFFGKRSAPFKKGIGKFTIKKIIIDPGHGGKDTGAIGRYGIREKDIVLSFAKLLVSKLKKRGFNAILTRNSDKFLSLWKRCQVANVAGADIFISVHANAARSRYAKGLEVFFLSEATDDSARALAAAENEVIKYEDRTSREKLLYKKSTIWDMKLTEYRRQSRELASYIVSYVKRKRIIKSRGVKSANFYVLRGTRMPAILIELGFVTNSSEVRNLKNSSFKKRLADAICEGISAYKHKYELTKGFSI